MNEETLVWVDIETTGLLIQRDLILEIAASTSKLSDPFNVTSVYHAVASYKFNDPYGRIDPYVVKMHTDSGLWEDCRRSETSFYEMLQGFKKSLPAKSILAGASVHFDRDFLVTGDPTLRDYFSHRFYDVSAIKLFCRSMGMPELTKNEAHRAEEDVREDVSHAQKCAEWITQLRGSVG